MIKASKLSDFSLNNPESWVPIFGEWCGPGWSAGKRQELTEINCPKNETLTLDDLCCVHDKAYLDAAGKLDETEQKLKVDVIFN